MKNFFTIIAFLLMTINQSYSKDIHLINNQDVIEIMNQGNYGTIYLLNDKKQIFSIQFSNEKGIKQEKNKFFISADTNIYLNNKLYFYYKNDALFYSNGTPVFMIKNNFSDDCKSIVITSQRTLNCYAIQDNKLVKIIPTYN